MGFEKVENGATIDQSIFGLPLPQNNKGSFSLETP